MVARGGNAAGRFSALLCVVQLTLIEEEQLMSYEGHVKNGAIVLDDQVELPEGTLVRVDPIVPPKKHHPDVERFAGILPSDTGGKSEYYEHLVEKHQ